jgi:uncharacterized protein (TIGR03086 family)
MPGSESPLPTFLIIGAQKSGTRWLRVNLGRHPDVYTAPLEIMFFHSPERFEAGGLEWYRAQFSGWAGEPIVGEATPGYMMWRHRPRRVARRIAEVVPEARIIAILRNPVDRAQSAIAHFVSRGQLPSDSNLLELIRRTPPERDTFGLVAGGWYAASLKPYRELFGDRLLVLLHDDITDDPRCVYERALAHIGASPDFAPSDLETVLFSTRRSDSGESTESRNGRRDLSTEERQQLYAYFRDDVRVLEKMIGRDLSGWDPGGTYSVRLSVDPWKEPTPRGPRRGTVDVIDCYRRAASWIEGHIRAVSPEQHSLPTPCAEWDVHDLLNRLISLPHVSAAVLRDAADPMEDERDSFGEDAAASYRAAADELLSAMEEPGRLERTVVSPFGDMHADLWARFTFVNQVTHGWDLATATGQDATIPSSVLEVADRLARGVFSLIPRMPELFDVEVPVSDAATPTERFVAYLGRDPRIAPADSVSKG